MRKFDFSLSGILPGGVLPSVGRTVALLAAALVFAATGCNKPPAESTDGEGQGVFQADIIIYDADVVNGDAIAALKDAIADAADEQTGKGSQDDPIKISVKTFTASLKGDNDEGTDYLHKLFEAIPEEVYVFVDLSEYSHADGLGNMQWGVSAARNGNDRLVGVILPSAITTLGEETFLHCYALESVIVPENILEIGMSAFQFCDSLKTVTLAEGLQTIGYQAFSNCASLVSITIPSTVTTIHDGAFATSELTSFIIPQGVTTIPDRLFENCQSLSSVTIPQDVESIGYAAFKNCQMLTSITIPASVESIGWEAFKDCTNLRSLYLERSDGVTTLGGQALDDVPGDIAIYVPQDMLGDYKTAWSAYEDNIYEFTD